MVAEEALLAAVDIHKRFGTGEVLAGVSVGLRRGQIMVVIGPSGCGKTTLLRSLVLLDVPERGDIRIEGQSVPLRPGRDGARLVAAPTRLRELRRRCGVAFQGNSLWSHLTVLENVVEAPIGVHGVPKRIAIERAVPLLEALGIAPLCDRYPLHLSGGQQQRAGIARALATDPDILLLDEPTSALDPMWSARIAELLRACAAASKAVLVVTHDLIFARAVATTVVCLDRGQVIFQGPPASILSSQVHLSAPADGMAQEKQEVSS